MPKYDVNIYLTTFANVEVEADNESVAIETARQIVDKQLEAELQSVDTGHDCRSLVTELVDNLASYHEADTAGLL